MKWRIVVMNKDKLKFLFNPKVILLNQTKERIIKILNNCKCKKKLIFFINQSIKKSKGNYYKLQSNNPCLKKRT
jgi:hypothetical protein